MKLFLQKIAIFFIPILLLLFPFDLFLSRSLKKNQSIDFARGEYSIWNDLYEGKIDSDVVIYGSSRAWVQINPFIIQDSLNTSVYNLGMDGHNFWLQYLRHNILLEKNVKPKLIILSVDLFTLQKRVDLYNYQQFMPYMLWNEKMIHSLSSYAGFKAVDFYIPLVRYMGHYDFIARGLNERFNFNIHLKQERKRGFAAMDKEWNNDLELATNKMDKYRVEVDSATIALFDDFIIECKKENIQLVMVYPPEYIDGQKFVENRGEIINLFKGFAEEHSLKFLDFSKNKLCYDKTYFYNASHLNKEGAEIFSKELTKHIN